MGADDIGGRDYRTGALRLRNSFACRPALFERHLFVAVVAIAERASELHFGEAEAIAQAIGGAREALKFFAAAGIEQVELCGA